MAEKKLTPRATDAEEQRCAVGYKGQRTMPAVSKEFVKQARAYSELHRYCQDQYAKDQDEFVAYVNQAQTILKLKSSQVDLPYEVGSRAVCCKKLPTGMSRLQFFKNVTESNEKARPLLLKQASYLSDRLLRIRDSFTTCTKEGGCYAINDDDANTLLRGFRILEIVTLNHIAHINQCLSTEIVDPLSGCMNLHSLELYLKQNQQIIDRSFNAVTEILYKIEKNEAISRKMGVEAKPVSAKTNKRLRNAATNLQNIASFVWKHKFSLAVGTVMTIGAAPYLAPALQSAGVAFSTKGTDAAISTLIREFSYIFCRLTSSPTMIGLVISATMYAIVKANWFIGILGATLSGAAFASLLGASIATGGIGGAFGAGLIAYMKYHGITWESLIKGFFDNKFVTAGILLVPQLIMQYIGFVISTVFRVGCTLNNIATAITSNVQNFSAKATDTFQSFVGSMLPGASSGVPLTATGAEQVAGKTLESLSSILTGIENITINFAAGMDMVANLLKIYPMVTIGGPFFAGLLAYVFGNKNQELEEVNRLNNYNYELRDFIINETLLQQTATEALKKELANQESALTEFDQGRLSQNAVVSVVTEQLEALVNTIKPHQFSLLVQSKRETPTSVASLDEKVDIPTLQVPADSIKELNSAYDSFAEIDKVVASTKKVKEQLQETKKELIEAAEQAINKEEAKIYDKEAEKIDDLEQDINMPIKDPSVQVSIFSVPHPPTEPFPGTNATAEKKLPPLIATAALPPPPQPMFYSANSKTTNLPPPPPPSAALLEANAKKGIEPTKNQSNVQLPPPPAVTTPVSIAPKDILKVQEDTGASMALTNKDGAIEFIVEKSDGSFHQISPPLLPPPGSNFRLPTAQAGDQLLGAIKSFNASNLKPANRERLQKGLQESLKVKQQEKTEKFDFTIIMKNALQAKFKNLDAKEN